MLQNSFFKLIAIAIVYLCHAEITASQIALDVEHNAPIEGHTICMQKIQSSAFLDDKIIDLTQIKVSSTKQEVRFFSEASEGQDKSILFCVKGNNLSKFSQSNDTLYLQSIENNQGKILYNGKGIPYMFPCHLGDKLTFWNKEIHEYVDKIIYDAEGDGLMTLKNGFKIITPEEDTLTDVVDFQTEIKENHFIKNQKIENTKQAHRFYSKGYRYPIIEVLKEKLGDIESCEAYYYSKAVLENLTDDWNNKIIRDGQHETNNAAKQDNQEFWYEIESAGQSKGIVVKCKSKVECRLSLILASLGGMVVYTKDVPCPQNTVSTFILDTSKLITGTYILYLKKGNKMISETFKVK